MQILPSGMTIFGFWRHGKHAGKPDVVEGSSEGFERILLAYLAASWADHVAHAANVGPGATVAPELAHGQGILPGVIESAGIRAIPDADPTPGCTRPEVPPGCPAEGCDGPNPVSLQHPYVKSKIQRLHVSYSRPTREIGPS